MINKDRQFFNVDHTGMCLKQRNFRFFQFLIGLPSKRTKKQNHNKNKEQNNE
jgi:hypothetical protein